MMSVTSLANFEHVVLVRRERKLPLGHVLFLVQRVTSDMLTARGETVTKERGEGRKGRGVRRIEGDDY